MEIKKGDYKIENLYQGGYSSLNPDYGSIFTGYRTGSSTLGVATDPRVANVLQEISNKIAPGQKTVEISAVSPEVFEAIPRQHLKEVQRLAKLTGIDVTVHGPVLEASGLSREGFTESNREAVERQMVSAIEKTHEITPDGGVITFHSSAMLPSPEYRKISERERKERGIKETEEIQKMLVIDQESGQILPVERDVLHGLLDRDYKKGVEIPAEENIRILNQNKWQDSLTGLIAPIEKANRMLNETEPLARNILQRIGTGELTKENITDTQREVISRYTDSQRLLDDIRKHANSLFDKAYTYGSDNDRKEIDTLQKNFVQKTVVEHEGKKND